MPTGVTGSKALRHHLPMPKCVSASFAYNTSGIASGVSTGVIIPKGATITYAAVIVDTVFNGGTTNVVTVGYGANLNEIFDASTSGSSVTEGTAGVYTSAAALALRFTADQEVKVKYTQSGTAASTGAARLVIVYVEEGPTL
jgi:hypothetical protein